MSFMMSILWFGGNLLFLLPLHTPSIDQNEILQRYLELFHGSWPRGRVPDQKGLTVA